MHDRGLMQVMHEGAARVHPAIALTPEECIIMCQMHARPLINPVHSYYIIFFHMNNQKITNFGQRFNRKWRKVLPRAWNDVHTRNKLTTHLIFIPRFSININTHFGEKITKNLNNNLFWDSPRLMKDGKRGRLTAIYFWIFHIFHFKEIL